MGTMVGNVLNYAFHLIIGRMVSPIVYGEIESLISLIAIVSVPAGTLTLIATQYAASLKAEKNGKRLNLLLKYLNQKVLKFGLPVIFLAFLISPVVQEFLNIPDRLPIYLVWIVMLLSLFSANTVALLTGWQRFGDVNQVGIISTALKLFGGVVLIWFGFGVSGAMFAFILSTFFSYLISFFFLKKLFQIDGTDNKRIEKIIEISTRGYVVPAFYATLAIAILGNVDIVFAKHHLDPMISGEYGALSVISKILFFITGVITTVLFSMSAEKNYQKQNSEKTFFLAVSLVILVCIFATIFFGIYSESVMLLFFGDKYLAAAPYLIWFTITAALYSLASLFLQYLMSIMETSAARLFLALSSLEIGALIFWGESMYDIIAITIGTQVFGIIIGVWFILMRRYKNA